MLKTFARSPLPSLALSATLVLGAAPMWAQADDSKKETPASQPETKPTETKPTEPKPVEGQPASKDQPKPTTPAAPKTTSTPADPAKEQLVYVVLQTSMGDITLELNQTKAPLSVENFLKYVDDKHYDGTVYHRVINGFMVQGGGFTPDGKQKPVRDPIKNEGGNGLENKKYTVAMARTNVADSATSQFYINVGDNGFLNRAGSRDGVGYAVFGKVVAGTEVVDKIKEVRTGVKNGMGDWPAEDVKINTARRATPEEAAKHTAK